MGEQEIVRVPSAPREFKVINKKLVIIGFVVLVLALIFFAFTGDTITGNVIRGSEDFVNGSPVDSGIQLDAEIGLIQVPIETKQNLDEITLELVGSNARLFVGKDGVTDLSQLPLAVIKMEDFSGEITFDGSSLLWLKGTVSKLSINDLPTSATSGEIKVRVEDLMVYDKLVLKGISLREYSVDLESGSVSVNNGKVSLGLDGEPFLVEDFVGTLVSGSISEQGVVRQGTSLVGEASNIEVAGDFKMSFSK